MSDEEVIKSEAKEFYRINMENSGKSEAIDEIQELRARLEDFYSDEDKAIFLTEIEVCVTQLA